MNGLRTGQQLSQAEIHRQGLWHRAVHLYLFDAKGQLLLQKRSQTVDHYPGLWTISLTRHVNAGEGSSQALLRELAEELGLSSDQVRVEHLFSYRREATLSPFYIDRQINEVFVGFFNQENASISFDEREVSEVRFLAFEAFKDMVGDPFKRPCTSL